MNISIDVIKLVHLLSSSSFTINNFCLLAVFCSLYRLDSIYYNFEMVHSFLEGKCNAKRPSAIFSELLVSRLFLPQLITTYTSDCGRGMFSALHNMFWILLLPVPQFIVFSSKNLYQMLEYLRKPATMESRNKTADTFFDDLISAAWFLWFTSQLSL